jgi:hypothetical protein
MTTYLAAPSGAEGLVSVTVVVALITAGATFVIGWLNFRQQKSAHITDRLLRAIEQLGSDSQRIRMGAVFALERIAGESPSDRPHIVSTLAGLVREQLPATAVGDGGYVYVLMQRAPDAQAALTVLCRSPLSDDRRDSSEIGGLDLSRSDLRRANLRNADLRRASLWGSRLENADLNSADLTDSNLSNAYFGTVSPGQPGFKRGTDLRHSTLTRAKLDNTRNFGVAMTDGAIGLADNTEERVPS